MPNPRITQMTFSDSDNRYMDVSISLSEDDPEEITLEQDESIIQFPKEELASAIQRFPGRSRIAWTPTR